MSNPDAGVPNTVVTDAPSNPAGAIADAQSAFPDCPAGAVQPCPLAKKPPCVIRINATTAGTQKVRSGKEFDNAWSSFAKVHNIVPPDPVRLDNVLKPSDLHDKSLDPADNVVLVRGCKDVLLVAETTPPNTPVTWTVEQNDTANKPPAIAGNGVKATLKTNVQGSFSVIATLGPCKVVWNVIFVWVKVNVKSSSIKKRDDTCHTDPFQQAATSMTAFDSGNTDKDERPWEASVDVQILGGGSGQTLGIDKVKIHTLQNQIKTNFKAQYEKGSQTDFVAGGLPAVDSNKLGVDTPFMDFPGKVTPDNISATRTINMRDSPSEVVSNQHEKNNSLVKSVSGGPGFKTAVASVSDDAPNTFMVHASVTWSLDWNGVIKVDKDEPKLSGDYDPKVGKGTHVTGSDAFSLISPATGGQDAGVAGMETFPPNAREDFTVWNP